MDSREPQTAGLPGPAWPRPEPTDHRVEYEAIRHQIDSIDVARNRGGLGDSVSIRCTCGQTYERGEFSDHVATMIGRLFTGPNHCTCFEGVLADLPGFSLCAWHESLFASAKAEAAEQARRASGEREAALREALLSVRTTDQGIRDALAALGKPGTLAEAIVFSVAGAFLDARALLAADTPAREPGIDVERLARALDTYRIGADLWPQHSEIYRDAAREAARAVLAEYDRLAASDTATEDER